MTAPDWNPLEDGFHPTQLKIEAELENKRMQKEFKENLLSKVRSEEHTSELQSH